MTQERLPIGAVTKYTYQAVSECLARRIQKHDKVVVLIDILFGRFCYIAVDNWNSKLHNISKVCFGCSLKVIFLKVLKGCVEN